MLRALLIAAIGGGVLLGRRAMSRAVRERLPAEIETAKRVAAGELDKSIGEFIRERLIAFVSSSAVKAGLVGAFFLLHEAGELTTDGFRIVVAGLVTFFLGRDGLKTLPYLAPALRHMRRNGWRPDRAVRDFVAGVAFERAYARARRAVETGPARVFIALSNLTPHAISTEIAEAVADLARTTSVERARMRAFYAAAAAGATFALYAGFIVATLAAA